MKITLETVRDTLRRAFGRESHIASIIRAVEPDETCSTACICAAGTMKYNPRFVNSYVGLAEDQFCLIAHELMHPLFGHFTFGGGRIENLAADIVINATLSQLFAKASGDGSLFKRYYKPMGWEGLLRPESRMSESRFSRLYDAFYRDACHRQALSTGEVIHTLKILCPEQEPDLPQLIGSHGESAEKGTTLWPADVVEMIVQDFRKAVESDAAKRAGSNTGLYLQFLDVLRSNQTLNRKTLGQYVTRRRRDRFKTVGAMERRNACSAVPVRPSRRDLVLLGAGILPLHFRMERRRPQEKNEGLAIYLDVSGSVNEHLPQVVGALRGLRRELTSVYLFSNRVVETPFAKLLGGQIETTFGTDFDCIAESILEQRLETAIVLTDGYASLGRDRAAELKNLGTRILVVLFGGKRDCPEFAPFGETLQLADVCC